MFYSDDKQYNETTIWYFEVRTFSCNQQFNICQHQIAHTLHLPKGISQSFTALGKTTLSL